MQTSLLLWEANKAVSDLSSFYRTIKQIKTVQPQPATPVNKSQLGQRLRQIRAEIVASGEHLLTREELEKEIASRRGGIY